MAITVNIANNGLSLKVAEDWNRTIDMKLIVTTSSNEGPKSIYDYLQTHSYAMYSTYSCSTLAGDTDSACVLKQMSIDQASEKANVWIVSLSYGGWNPYEETSTGSPLDIQPKAIFEPQTYEEIADLDKDGNPILNACYEYYDPPVMKQVSTGILRVTKNYSTWNDSTYLGYADYINTDTWNGFAPRTMKVSAPRKQILYSQIIGNYLMVEWEFKFDRKTWVKYVLNQGYHYLDGTTRRNILIDGVPTSAPVPLDSAGAFLVPPVDSSSIVINEYHIYDEISFASTFGLTGLSF